MSNDKPKSMAQSEMAEVLAKELEGRYVFDDVSGTWCSQIGTAWKPTREVNFRREVGRCLKSESGGFSASYRAGVMTLLQDELSGSEWETGRRWLPFKNGILDLDTNKFLENKFNPAHPAHSAPMRVSPYTNPTQPYTQTEKYGLFNWQLPYDFNPDAKCPTFSRWLKTVTEGDQDMIKLLSAWLVVLVRGGSGLQKYLELIGKGGTGKSTFLRICASLVGEENRTTTDLKSLEGRFESANLYGKRLVQITDSAHYMGEVSTLKALTGGDPIRYEVKNRQAGEPFTFSGLVMLAANEHVKPSDLTSGLSRRRIPLPFSRKIEESDKKEYEAQGGIETVIEGELSGIVNWLLAMDYNEARKTIREPAGIVARFKIESELATNPLLRWANESLAICDDGLESLIGQKSTLLDDADSRLYPNYCRWSEGENTKPLSLVRFSDLLEQALDSHNIKTSKKRRRAGTILSNLRIRTNLDQLLIERKECVQGCEGQKTSETRMSAGCAGYAGPSQTFKFQNTQKSNKQPPEGAENPTENYTDRVVI